MSGIAGLVNYDKSLMELVNINVKKDFIGANNNGKFLYLGNSLDSSNSEYVMFELTFKALSSGNGTISVTDNELFNKDTYYNTQDMDVSTQVVINTSADNELSSLKVAGQEIQLKSGVLEYRISVDNDVVTPNVEAITNNVAAKVTSIEAPEELVEGDNIVKVKVTAENGDELVYTIIVNRKAKESNDNNNNTKPVSYQNDNNVAEDTQEDINLPANDDKKNDAIKDNKKDDEKKESNTSRIIIIILILLVIAGLIYLIFKDDEEDDDVKKANKDINKLKKENIKASTSKSNIKKSKK